MLKLVLFWFVGALFAQSQITVNVKDPRPLAKAVEQLEQSIGIPINYEDIPYEHPADITDVTASVVRDKVAGAQVLVPRGGPLNLIVPVSGANKNMPVSVVDKSLAGTAVITSLLSVHKAAGYPGEYSVSEKNSMLYVTPNRLLKSSGLIENIKSVLDNNVTLAYEERPAAETLQLLLSNAAAESKTKIGLGMVPLSLLAQRMTFGANNEPARDAIARLFALISPLATTGFAYHMYFDPRLRYYMFNAHPVQLQATPTPVLPTAITTPNQTHYTHVAQ